MKKLSNLHILLKIVIFLNYSGIQKNENLNSRAESKIIQNNFNLNKKTV